VTRQVHLAKRALPNEPPKRVVPDRAELVGGEFAAEEVVVSGWTTTRASSPSARVGVLLEKLPVRVCELECESCKHAFPVIANEAQLPAATR
jgi:hypothetical protein